MAMTKEQRSAAARLGWERRKAKQAAALAAKQKRSEAARKGWETRRKREMAREMEKEWLKEQEKQRQEEEYRQAQAEAAAGLYSQAEAIDDQLRAILLGGPGGKEVGAALNDALDALIDEIGEEAYYQNLSNNANLIMDRAEKITYKYEHEQKTNYAQAIYSAASGGKAMPDSFMTAIYAGSNADRRAAYKHSHPNAKSRGAYKKRK